MNYIHIIGAILLIITVIKLLFRAIARARTKSVISHAKSCIFNISSKSAGETFTPAQQKSEQSLKEFAHIVDLAFQSEKAAYIAKMQENPLEDNLHFLDFIYIAGTRYHDVVQANMQKTGNFLRVCREESNPHDCNAISLASSNGSKIGYIPRKFNSIPAALFDAGYPLTIKIISAHPSSEAPIIRAAIYIPTRHPSTPATPATFAISAAPDASATPDTSACRFRVDSGIIQSIIDDKKQELCPLHTQINAHFFIDLILIQLYNISCKLEGTLPLLESDFSLNRHLSLKCIPQNQQTAVQNLIHMQFNIFAVINQELSMDSAGIIIAELYANI